MQDPDSREAYIEFDEAPYLELPKTVGEFRKAHKHKFWYNIARGEKLFLRDFGPLEFLVTAERDLLFEYLPKIREVFSRRWNNVHTSLGWDRAEEFKKYHDAMIDLSTAGNGEIALLVNKGVVLAFAYNLICDKKYYFFQHAVRPDQKYRKYSLGKILIAHLMEDVIRRGFETFDFMTGKHGYKGEWADKSRKVYLRVCEKKDFSGYFRFLAKTAFYRLRSFVHRHKKAEFLLKRLIK